MADKHPNPTPVAVMTVAIYATEGNVEMHIDGPLGRWSPDRGAHLGDLGDYFDECHDRVKAWAEERFVTVHKGASVGPTALALGAPRAPATTQFLGLVSEVASDRPATLGTDHLVVVAQAVGVVPGYLLAVLLGTDEVTPSVLEQARATWERKRGGES